MLSSNLASLVAVGLAAGLPVAMIPGWSNPARAAGFAGLRFELQHMADTAGHHRVNHFCVVIHSAPPTASSTSQRLAYAYWQEEHLIQGFGPTKYAALDDSNMAGAPSIDLRENVVDTRAQIGGSASRVLRSEVDMILGACNKVGARFVVTRRVRYP